MNDLDDQLNRTLREHAEACPAPRWRSTTSAAGPPRSAGAAGWPAASASPPRSR